MYLPQDIIRQKRIGNALSDLEIEQFVDGLVTKGFNDAQVGAMAMAILLNGMSVAETSHLTKTMMYSGDVLSWPEIDGPVLDKHSTGGVGDKVSFMLAAIVAACGGYVPMISGRSLGHTGGTADKLESIAGFNTEPSNAQFKKIVKELGIAIITQTSNLAPADKRLYGIRDVTSTVESIPLITASILSKKLAAGLDALVMDIKVGNGAMMDNIDDAKALANSIVNVANHAGVPTRAVITDMNQVLGNSAGNALEMAETAAYLTGEYREPRLHGVVKALAVEMLIAGKLADNETNASAKVESVLASGHACEKFDEMISVLGGPRNFCQNPWNKMETANHTAEIIAPEDAYLTNMDTRKIGQMIVRMGGGRTQNGQALDHSVGLSNLTPLGSKVNKGDVIGLIHINDKEHINMFTKDYISTLTFSEQTNTPEPLIYQTIG